jgi:hypothetical protein
MLHLLPFPGRFRVPVVCENPVLCEKSAEQKREQFRNLGSWHGRRSRPTSDTLTGVLGPMNTLQLQFLVLIFAGWVNRRQLDVIAFCFERRVPRTAADRAMRWRGASAGRG